MQVNFTLACNNIVCCAAYLSLIYDHLNKYDKNYLYTYTIYTHMQMSPLETDLKKFVTKAHLLNLFVLMLSQWHILCKKLQDKSNQRSLPKNWIFINTPVLLLTFHNFVSLDHVVPKCFVSATLSLPPSLPLVEDKIFLSPYPPKPTTSIMNHANSGTYHLLWRTTWNQLRFQHVTFYWGKLVIFTMIKIE